jgi:Ca2+-binding EF-hand superfamily protein
LVRRTRCAADRVASASGPCEKQLGNREALLPDQLMSDCANAANALHEKQASTATHDQVIDETSSKNDANGTTKPWHPEPSQSDQRAQRSLADEAVFRSFVHRNGERQGGVDLPSLSMGNFCKLVRQTLGICEQRIARRLFRVFDVNQDGRVSSSEYVRTMQLIGFGTPRENMKLFFDLYDMDQSGSIHQNQVRAMLCEGHRELWEHIMFAEDVMCAVDKTGAVLTEEQFYTCCEHTPHIFDAFVNGFPATVADTLRPDESAITGIGALHEGDVSNGDSSSSRSSSRSHAHWREMRKNKSSSWSTARELWVLMMKATASASASSRVMDYAAFQRVMVSRFDPNSDLDRMLCARLFACFDSNGDGDVSVREFMQGLQRVFRGSAADQSAFYFALFDLDGDGEISEAELCRVLVTRRSKLGLAQWSEGQLVTEVGLIMQLVDGNHSGTIDLEEIKRASIEYPHVLQCFEACVFGGGTT